MSEIETPIRRLLITGSRDWQNAHTISAALFDYWYRADRVSDILLIHGGAKGADQMAAQTWAANGFQTAAYLADWDTHGNRAGILRNLHMLDDEPEHVLAFIRNNSRGATHCATEAQRRGIPTTIFREV